MSRPKPRAANEDVANAQAREGLERRWHARLRAAPELAELVTGAQLADEAFHRWFAYKQAFAPELVRRFLADASVRLPGPLLDPFSGAGTLAIECARRGVQALGVEALPSLAALARARGVKEIPRLPEVGACSSVEEFAGLFTLEAHRAALLLAEARRHDSDGAPLRQAPNVRAALREALRVMREDCATPLPLRPSVVVGDARDLAELSDGSMAGALTSPPYLSRHDYAQVTAPIERIYSLWYPQQGAEPARAKQVRAFPRALRREWRRSPHPAVAEAQSELAANDQSRLAGVTRSYFEDLGDALATLRRVLRESASAWIVLGGARFGPVYVPSDLIAAELAEERGFSVVDLLVARRLVPAGRPLGRLDDVAPRETLLILKATS